MQAGEEMGGTNAAANATLRTHIVMNPSVKTFTTLGLNTKEAHALLRDTVALAQRETTDRDVLPLTRCRLSASATVPVSLSGLAFSLWIGRPIIVVLWHFKN